MSAPIQLIVGLGNPGEKYAETRHNAGAWLVELLAREHGQTLREETKLLAFLAKIELNENPVWLMIPTTYMNESGRAVQAVSRFYKIPNEQILVAHDELDFPPGTVKFKEGGGHGGHNGLRDIINKLGKNNFHRLRLGIGHPGNPEAVTSYVLKRAPNNEQEAILDAIGRALEVLPDFVSGEQQKAIRNLHTTAGV